MTPTGGWQPVFRAGWQGRKVAALWTGFLLVTLGFAALAALGTTESARETGVALAAAMALFVVALEGFRWHYVTALDQAPDGRLRVQTVRLGVGRWTEHPARTLTPGGVRTGEWEGNGMSGVAPWVPLRRRGHRFPFVLDLQGDVLNAAGFRRLTGLSWSPAAPSRPRRRRA